MSDLSDKSVPIGELVLQTIAMPKETNINGDIFGGWLLGQMDLAGGILASRVADGRITTVAVSSMVFLNPVPVGSVLSCYAQTQSIGTSSIRLFIEAWCKAPGQSELCKVTEGEFVFVAIDDQGVPRAIEKNA